MVLFYGNLTECGVCLDSDFFDLWRSCGDCNVTYMPQCQVSCESCLAGEGEDTAEVPAPRANQQVAIPAAGCSVRRRNFQLGCDQQSEGSCGVVPATSTSGIGTFLSTMSFCCQPCANSSFVNDCEGCSVLGCQVSCDSCLGANRSGGPPQSLTIPAGGCTVFNKNSQLICTPGTEGSCPLVPMPLRPSHLAPWKIGVSVAGSLLGLIVIAVLAVLWWRRRYRIRHIKKKLNEPIMGVELSKEPEKLVHASIISSANIQVCKRPNGEDWLLGKGSYGRVYKAKLGGQLDVAVKTIHREHVNPHLTAHEALQAIAKELRILEIIPFDKRIVQLYGSCSMNSNILLVLEFMEGGDLQNALKGLSTAPALSWYNRGAQIALDIIQGLHFLHSNNIVHRDIKTGNILLSKDCDSAKICDVGLARIMNNTSIASSSHNATGTYAYAAPEILLFERSDQRADIFSYGVLLWELITQEQPQRANLRDILVPQECPQAISDVVTACTSSQPSDRPSAQQIIGVIESSMADTHAGKSGCLQHDA